MELGVNVGGDENNNNFNDNLVGKQKLKINNHDNNSPSKTNSNNNGKKNNSKHKDKESNINSNIIDDINLQDNQILINLLILSQFKIYFDNVKILYNLKYYFDQTKFFIYAFNII